MRVESTRVFFLVIHERTFENDFAIGASVAPLIKRDSQPATSGFDKTILIAKFITPQKKQTLFFTTDAQRDFQPFLLLSAKKGKK